MKKIDKVAVLEQRAEEGLGVIDDFISSLEQATLSAAELNEEAQLEIDRCKTIQKKCNKVTGFTTKLLKLTK